MKKILMALVVAGIVIVLIGCQKATPDYDYTAFYENAAQLNREIQTMIAPTSTPTLDPTNPWAAFYENAAQLNREIQALLAARRAN